MLKAVSTEADITGQDLKFPIKAWQSPQVMDMKASKTLQEMQGKKCHEPINCRHRKHDIKYKYIVSGLMSNEKAPGKDETAENENKEANRRPSPRLMMPSTLMVKNEKAEREEKETVGTGNEEVDRKVSPKFRGSGKVVSDNQEKMLLFSLV